MNACDSLIADRALQTSCPPAADLIATYNKECHTRSKSRGMIDEHPKNVSLSALIVDVVNCGPQHRDSTCSLFRCRRLEHLLHSAIACAPKMSSDGFGYGRRKFVVRCFKLPKTRERCID